VWFQYHSTEHSLAATRQSQHALLNKRQGYRNRKKGDSVAQYLVSWLLVGGRFRIYAINGVGRCKGRIIEVEVIATGERFHGSTRRMERLVRALEGSDDDRRHDRAWTPELNS
jgi:hypothetical protein